MRGIERCRRAVTMLEVEPTRPIASVADELGISHAYLDRESTRVVGLTPRVLARLLRMRRLLAGLDVRGAIAWADLSAESGWYDQAPPHPRFPTPHRCVAVGITRRPTCQLHAGRG
jgi:methylphosphotriester-DNA--protein-cysteine methyltransferase